MDAISSDGGRRAGRNVLITGGASGIGKAAATAMVRDGANIFIADLDQETAERVCAELSAPGVTVSFGKADVSDRKSMEVLKAMVDAAFPGGLDVIIHSAGQWMDYAPLVSCSEETWQRLISVNLTSHFYLAQVFLPAMMAARRGSVVFVSSISGRTGGTGGTIPYAAAKGGVNALMRGLAHEMAPYGIRINAVAPGLVDTPLLQRPLNKARTEEWIKRMPMGRAARPEEVAGAIMLLATEAGSYITGEIIEVNGGILMD